jgi:predicted SnoaL-like aldol condensation-catalyzing enzyme
MTSEVSGKQVAVSFLRLASSGKAREAFDTYVGGNFRHHNAYYRGDPESLITAMDENAHRYPEKTLEFQRTLEDGNLVAVHSRVRMNSDDPGASLVHIFRFDGALIVELWDIAQAVPKDCPNENGMF